MTLPADIDRLVSVRILTIEPWIARPIQLGGGLGRPEGALWRR